MRLTIQGPSYMHMGGGWASLTPPHQTKVVPSPLLAKICLILKRDDIFSLLDPMPESSVLQICKPLSKPVVLYSGEKYIPKRDTIWCQFLLVFFVGDHHWSFEPAVPAVLKAAHVHHMMLWLIPNSSTVKGSICNSVISNLHLTTEWPSFISAPSHDPCCHGLKTYTFTTFLLKDLSYRNRSRLFRFDVVLVTFRDSISVLKFCTTAIKSFSLATTILHWYLLLMLFSAL